MCKDFFSRDGDMGRVYLGLDRRNLLPKYLLVCLEVKMFEYFDAFIKWGQVLGWQIPIEFVFGGTLMFGGYKIVSSKGAGDFGIFAGLIGIIIGAPIFLTSIWQLINR